MGLRTMCDICEQAEESLKLFMADFGITGSPEDMAVNQTL